MDTTMDWGQCAGDEIVVCVGHNLYVISTRHALLLSILSALHLHSYPCVQYGKTALDLAKRARAKGRVATANECVELLEQATVRSKTWYLWVDMHSLKHSCISKQLLILAVLGAMRMGDKLTCPRMRRHQDNEYDRHHSVNPQEQRMW